MAMIIFSLLVFETQGVLLVGLATPNTALTAAADYSLSFQRTVTLGSSSTIYIQLSNLFLNINPTSCTFQVNGTGAFSSATCAAGTYQSQPAILLTNLPYTGLISQLAFQFKLNNPKIQGLIPMTLAIIDSSGATVTESFSLSFNANTMTCTVGSSTDIVGVQNLATEATHTYTITPSVTLLQGSFIQIIYPNWFNSSNRASANASIQCSSPQITGIACSNSSGTLSTTVVTSVLTANISTGVSLALFYMYNPPSMAPFGPITIGVYDNSQNKLTQQCTPSLTVGTPSTFKIMNPQGINNVISSSTILNFTLQPKNPIPGGTSGLLEIIYDATLTATYTSNINPPTLLSSTSTTFQFSPVGSSAITSFFFVRSFNFRNPPSIKPATITVTSYAVDGSNNKFAIDRTQYTIVCAVGAITSASISPNDGTPDSIVSRTLTFTTSNSLLTSSAIRIVIPSQLGISSTTCSSAAGSCIRSGNIATVTPSSTLLAGTLAVTFANMVNPPTASQTDSFQIRTYYSSTDIDTLVNQVTSGLKITINTFPMPSTNFVFTPNSLVVGATTTYDFSVVLSVAIPASGYFQLVFPSDFSLSSPALTVISTSMDPGCSVTTTSFTLKSNGCFGTTKSAGSTIRFRISGVINPTSLRPTAAFQFFTKSSLGLGVESLTASAPNLIATMTTAQTATMVVSPANVSINTVSDLNVQLTFFFARATNQYMTFTLPSQVRPTSASCRALVGLSSLSCAFDGTNIKGIMSFTVFPINKKVSFVIQNYRNNQASTLSLGVYTSDGYLSQQGSQGISPCPASCSVCPSAVVCTTCYTPALLYQSTCYATCPTTTFQSGVSCLPCSSDCATCSSASSCSVCTSGFVLTNAACAGSCPAGQYGQSGVCVSCALKCTSCTGPTACSQCQATSFLINGRCFDNCPTGFFQTGSTCTTCSSGCQDCTSTAVCDGCRSGYFILSGICYQPCPVTYYGSGTTCLTCSAPCDHCSSAIYCLTCLPGFSYNLGTCQSGCLDGYFQGATSCQPCAAGCQLCSSATSCSDCKGELVNYNGACTGSCPTGTIVASAVCYACDSTCVTCSGTINNCTKCTQGVVTPVGCSDTCPLGLLPVNDVCEKFSGSLIITPFLITAIFGAIAIAGLKYCYPTMTVVPNLIAIWAPLQFGAWLYYLAQVAGDAQTVSAKTLAIALLIIGLILQIALGIVFVVFMGKTLQEDDKFRQWDQASWCHNARLIISGVSVVNMKAYRLLYGRMISRSIFSAYSSNKQAFFLVINGHSMADLVFGMLPVLISAGLYLSGKHIRNQPFVCAVEVLILDVLLALLIIYDVPKQDDFFSSSVEIDHGITDKPWQANSSFEFRMVPEVSEQVVVGDGMCKTNKVKRKILEQGKGGKKGLPGIQEDSEDEQSEFDLTPDKPKREMSEPDENRKLSLVKRVLGDQAVDELLANDQQRRQFYRAVMQNRSMWAKRQRSLPDEQTLHKIYNRIKLREGQYDPDHVNLTQQIEEQEQQEQQSSIPEKDDEKSLFDRLGLSHLKEVAVSFKDKILIKGNQKASEPPSKSRSTTNIIKGLQSYKSKQNGQSYNRPTLNNHDSKYNSSSKLKPTQLQGSMNQSSNDLLGYQHNDIRQVLEKEEALGSHSSRVNPLQETYSHRGYGLFEHPSKTGFHNKNVQHVGESRPAQTKPSYATSRRLFNGASNSVNPLTSELQKTSLEPDQHYSEHYINFKQAPLQNSQIYQQSNTDGEQSLQLEEDRHLRRHKAQFGLQAEQEVEEGDDRFKKKKNGTQSNIKIRKRKGMGLEQIYLQRLDVPQPKNNFRVNNNKKKNNKRAAMDEDNDVFDLDF